MEWRDHVYGTLAAHGLKHGGARERVIEVLAEEACALSAADIDETLKSSNQYTGRATIYRTLELLSELGVVERLEVGDGTTRFERALPGGHHHHHLVCQQCGRLVPFDDPALERAIDRLSRRLGVSVQSHDVLLHGECGRC